MIINTPKTTNKITKDSHLTALIKAKIKLFSQLRVHNGHVIIKQTNNISHKSKNYSTKRVTKLQPKRVSMTTLNKVKFLKTNIPLLMIMCHHQQQEGRQIGRQLLG